MATTVPISRRCASKPGDDIAAQVALYRNASGVLLDTYVPGIPGGTGEAFDWSLVPQGLSKPIILAGGLTADNVAQAIAQVRPYAVDVSGGVERPRASRMPRRFALLCRQ